MTALLAVPASMATGSEGEPAPAPVGISAEDAELLQDLDLLIELEFLSTWDPVENLPIPVEDEPTRPGREREDAP